MTDERWQMSAGWGGQTWAAEYLCDDGGRKLSSAHRALLDQAIARARRHPEGECILRDGDVCATVNMFAGEQRNIPRFAIDVAGHYVAGGMINAPSPRTETITRINERRLPDAHFWE